MTNYALANKKNDEIVSSDSY